MSTAAQKEVTQQDLDEFLVILNKRVADSYSKNGYQKTPPTITADVGKNYVRLVRNNESGGGHSAYGFVDIETGLLYKAASWKTPAKNFARGSLFVILDNPAEVNRFDWISIR